METHCDSRLHVSTQLYYDVINENSSNGVSKSVKKLFCEKLCSKRNAYEPNIDDDIPVTEQNIELYHVTNVTPHLRVSRFAKEKNHIELALNFTIFSVTLAGILD